MSDEIRCRIQKEPESLNDKELLQLIIANGCNGCGYKEIAESLHDKFRILGVDEIRYRDIKSVRGIGHAKASQIYAMLVFIKRYYRYRH